MKSKAIASKRKFVRSAPEPPKNEASLGGTKHHGLEHPGEGFLSSLVHGGVRIPVDISSPVPLRCCLGEL